MEYEIIMTFISETKLFWCKDTPEQSNVMDE